MIPRESMKRKDSTERKIQDWKMSPTRTETSTNTKRTISYKSL